MSAKQRLFNATRSYSQLLVGVAVILSLFFTAFLGSDNLNWQISLAVIALIIGIPHGALDHLVTLPKDKPAKMALFVIIYVLIAVAAVWAILRWNVLGFQLEALLNTSKYTFKDIKDSAQKGNFRAAYFNVPFLLQYKLLGKATLPKLWLLCGPQYSGLLSVKSLNNYNTTGDILRKSNFGVVVGLEARFLRFSAGARYIHGLEDINNDVIKAAGGTWSTRSLQFTAGVKFL
jgi:hypothetical protein